MTTDTTISPVVKNVTVPCSVERAFDLFTSQISAWWPLPTHSVGQSESHTVEMDCRPGGQIVESVADGTRETWGTITEWAPTHRVEFSWHPGQSDAEATHVAVTFEESGNGTLVTLTHTGWEMRADGFEARHRYDTGWDVVLAPFVALASRENR